MGTIFGLPETDAGPPLIVEGETDLTIGLSGFGSFDISRNFERPLIWNTSEYLVKVCHTGVKSQSMVFPVTCSDTKERIGFVFPVTAFRNDPPTTNRYKSSYGDVALRKILEEVGFFRDFGNDISFDGLKDRKWELDDILIEDISILVVSKTMMQAKGFSENLLLFALRCKNVAVCFTKTDAELFSDLKMEEKNVQIDLPNIDLSTDLKILQKLLLQADRDNSDIGKFIQYYQFQEFLLRRVFDWAIPEIAKLNLAPRKMKDELSGITGEKVRIQKIRTECLQKIGTQEPFHDLKLKCKNFLDAVGESFNPDDDWATLLYKCRNLIVHSQLALLAHEFSSTLTELNSSLRKVVLISLFNFELPSKYKKPM